MKENFLCQFWQKRFRHGVLRLFAEEKSKQVETQFDPHTSLRAPVGQALPDNSKKHAAFSLVEMLMALLVASLLMAALAPVITKRMDENLHVTGEFGLGDKNVKTYEISYNDCLALPGAEELTAADGSKYCEGEWVVPNGYSGPMNVILISAGGGGGTAPTAGYTEYTSTNTFTVPAMVNQLEATLISGGAGGGAGGQVEKNVDYKTAGEFTWNVPAVARGKNALITACGGGGGGGGTTGSGTNCGTVNSEYLSGAYAGYGGGGGYVVNKAVTLGNSASLIVGGGGGGGARGVTAAYATGNSASYGGGGGGGADKWGAGSGFGGSGGSEGGAGGSYRAGATGCGLGGGKGDTSSSTNGVDGVKGSDAAGGTGSSNGGASFTYTNQNLVTYYNKPGQLCTGGGGGGGSLTGHGGGGGGGGAGTGGGGGGGGATIFGTRNNRIVTAPGGGGGGGGTIDHVDHISEYAQLGFGKVNWVYKNNAWECLFGPCALNPLAYGSGGGGGGGGGEGGGDGGRGSRVGRFGAGDGSNGAGYQASTIFGANNCGGGIGAAAENHACPKQGGNGQPGAMRITYLDYGPGGSGGGGGQMVPIQPVNVKENEILNINIGKGGTGGKAGKIENNATAPTAAERGHGGNSTEQYNIPSDLARGTNTILSTIPEKKVGGVGAWGGSPTGESLGPWIQPHHGCQGYITNGVTYGWLNNNYSAAGFITENGKTAGNTSYIGVATYANGTIGGDGGTVTTPWFTCTPGKGGTASSPVGGNASGYGCGGGGGYGLSDGGKGSNGYARLSWNLFWDTEKTNSAGTKGDYKRAEIGSGGGGTSGNIMKFSVNAISGQAISIRIGKGGQGAYVANNAVIPATKGGDTVLGTNASGEIRVAGGVGGVSPAVTGNAPNTKFINGSGGKLPKTNICKYSGVDYTKRSSYCTIGADGNDPIGSKGGVGGSLNGHGEGGAGGIQDNGDNSFGAAGKGVGSGGGGAAIRELSGSISINDILNNPNKGGDGGNGKIIIQVLD